MRRHPHLDLPQLADTMTPLADPPAWMTEALCAQVDPEIFPPNQGKSTAPAIAVCRRCPITQACLQHALTNNETQGVWGGMSAMQRAQHHRRRAV